MRTMTPIRNIEGRRRHLSSPVALKKKVSNPPDVASRSSSRRLPAPTGAMSGTAVFKEAQSRPRSISGVRLEVAPAFSAELRRGSGDKGSQLVAVTPGIGSLRYEGSRRHHRAITVAL